MKRGQRDSQNTDEARRFALYDQLDRLEELIEDMTELGVRSIDDAEARMEQLNAAIDEIESHGTDQ